jgi:hypothetical protein
MGLGAVGAGARSPENNPSGLSAFCPEVNFLLRVLVSGVFFTWVLRISGPGNAGKEQADHSSRLFIYLIIDESFIVSVFLGLLFLFSSFHYS